MHEAVGLLERTHLGRVSKEHLRVTNDQQRGKLLEPSDVDKLTRKHIKGEAAMKEEMRNQLASDYQQMRREIRDEMHDALLDAAAGQVEEPPLLPPAFAPTPSHIKFPWRGILMGKGENRERSAADNDALTKFMKSIKLVQGGKPLKVTPTNNPDQDYRTLVQLLQNLNSVAECMSLSEEEFKWTLFLLSEGAVKDIIEKSLKAGDSVLELYRWLFVSYAPSHRPDHYVQQMENYKPKAGKGIGSIMHDLEELAVLAFSDKPTEAERKHDREELIIRTLKRHMPPAARDEYGKWERRWFKVKGHAPAYKDFREYIVKNSTSLNNQFISYYENNGNNGKGNKHNNKGGGQNDAKVRQVEATVKPVVPVVPAPTMTDQLKGFSSELSTTLTKDLKPIVAAMQTLSQAKSVQSVQPTPAVQPTINRDSSEQSDKPPKKSKARSRKAKAKETRRVAAAEKRDVAEVLQAGGLQVPQQQQSNGQGKYSKLYCPLCKGTNHQFSDCTMFPDCVPVAQFCSICSNNSRHPEDRCLVKLYREMVAQREAGSSN